MQIRILNTVTDAEVAAIAAEAQVPYTRSTGLTYQKGDVWHVANELGVALCTAERFASISAPTKDDPTRTTEEPLGPVAEEVEPAAAPDPAPDHAPIVDATVAPDTEE